MTGWPVDAAVTVDLQTRHRIVRRDVHAVAVPAQCELKQTPSRSMAQAMLSRRSATEHREPGVSVTAPGQRLILGAAGRIALGGDASSVIGGVAQAVVSGQAAHHERALPCTPGDRRYPAAAAQRVVVSPPPRAASLGEQRGEHVRPDAGQRQQDGRVSRCVRRRWLGLRGRGQGVGRRGLGELPHQSVEVAARVIELPVDQGEALGDKPPMRNGGLGGARCDPDGGRPQSPA